MSVPPKTMRQCAAAFIARRDVVGAMEVDMFASWVVQLVDDLEKWTAQRDELADELADIQLAMDDVEDELQAESVVGMVRELVAKYQALRK